MSAVNMMKKILGTVIAHIWGWLRHTPNWVPLLLNVGRLLVWLVVAAAMVVTGIGVYRFIHGSANFNWLYSLDDMSALVSAIVLIVIGFVAALRDEIRHDWNRDMMVLANLAAASASVLASYGVFTLFFGKVWGLTTKDPARLAAFGIAVVASFVWSFGILPLFIKFALNEYKVETSEGRWARLKRGDKICTINGQETDLYIDQIVEEMVQSDQKSAEIGIQRTHENGDTENITLNVQVLTKHKIHSVLGKIALRLGLLKAPAAMVLAVTVIYLFHQGIGGNFAMALVDTSDLFAKFVSCIMLPLTLIVYALSYPKNYSHRSTLARLILVLSILLWITFSAIIVRGIWMSFYATVNLNTVVWSPLFTAFYAAEATLFISTVMFGVPAILNRRAMIRSNLTAHLVPDESDS